MSLVAIIRPGLTEFDEQDRIQGSLDLPLSEQGEAQMTQIVEQLRGQGIEQIYTSPTDPARITAQRVGEALGVPVKEIEGLENVDHGLWQGLCVDEIKRKQPKVFKQWQDSPGSVCPPEGETCEDAFVRACKGLRKPLKKKGAFAVVSAEPMASLIEAVVRGEAPRLPSPGRRNGRALVELIERTPRNEAVGVD
ncbi:MAG: histidine phosphatase family protein [Planctomycetes bacterium]|nr:histidine phosphatase family protein [Planctomycetota bacterium]